MAVDVIRHTQPKLNVLLKLLPDVLGAALGQTAARARSAGDVRSNAIFIHVQQRVLEIVNDKSKTHRAIAAADSIPVVGIGAGCVYRGVAASRIGDDELVI